MNKGDIAEILRDMGVILELKGENPFRTRAYEMGARALEGLDEDLETLIQEKRLHKVKGIGSSIAEKVEELSRTGNLKEYEELRGSLPEGLIAMLEIPGVGPKRIKTIYDKLKVTNIAELTQACEDGWVAELSGFGEKSQEKILSGIRNREAYGKRHLWWDAATVANPILEALRKLPQVEGAEHAGSLRRGLETVGDLDFVVASTEPLPIMDWFVGMEGVAEVTAKGTTKSSVRLHTGMQADLRIVPPHQYVYALHHFTGSKDHNVALRQRALGLGYSVSEWGLKKGEGKMEEGEAEIPVQTEEDFFRLLKLNYIPPELREGFDEIECAEKGKIPRLVEASDIRGVFHNHTAASDGRNTLLEMARAAEAHGWEYLGIADHSKASVQANGLDEKRLEEQINEIARFNKEKCVSLPVFAGVECDILPDGRLDLDDSVLKKLDYVVVSIHSSFTQSEEDMTRRIIRAIEHPATTMLAHVTGRLLLLREGYPVNHGKIIDAAAANGVIIEINAHPRRLDMDWRHWKRAAEKGVLTSINPDAHSTDGFKYFRAGVTIARKGWLTKENVFNTRSLEEVRKWLKAKRGK